MNTSSFYQSVAMIIVRVIPRNAVSRLIGRFASSQASRPFIGLFAKAVKIDLGEAEKDIAEYPTLTAFFTRQLRPGARVIDSTRDVLVSPVDGVLAEAGLLDTDTTFTVKGRRFDAGTLLGCADDRNFVGGGYSVHYLSPRDYHWIHSPQDGLITGWTHMPGDCLPVFPKAVEKFDGLFTRNERVIVRMEGHLGGMAVAMVAAMGVGNIKLPFADVSTNCGGIAGHSELTQSIPTGRGDRLGVFMLGSTVVLLWKNPRIVIDRTKVGTHLKMGEAFASLRAD